MIGLIIVVSLVFLLIGWGTESLLGRETAEIVLSILSVGYSLGIGFFINKDENPNKQEDVFGKLFGFLYMSLVTLPAAGVFMFYVTPQATNTSDSEPLVIIPFVAYVIGAGIAGLINLWRNRSEIISVPQPVNESEKAFSLPETKEESEPVEEIEKSSALPETKAKSEPVGGIKYASFLQRLAAFLLDSFICGAPPMILFVLILSVSDKSLLLDEENIGGLISLIFVLGISFGNSIVLKLLKGQSPGKKIMGIVVIQAGGQEITWKKSLLRPILYLVSTLPYYVGFFWMFWDKQKRCLHDIIGKTLVVTVKSKEYLHVLQEQSESEPGSIKVTGDS